MDEDVRGAAARASGPRQPGALARQAVCELPVGAAAAEDTPRLLDDRSRVLSGDGPGAGDLSRSPFSTICPCPSYPFLLPPVESDEIGRLGNYRVLNLLGKGGMALVFLAEDIGLRRRVALKVQKPDLARELDACQRFLREARIMASIKHENLVTVFQVGQENGVVYLAMEWLQGQTVEDWSHAVGRAPVADILSLGRSIAAGLAVIHRQGLVHRDLKPANIWLETTEDGRGGRGEEAPTAPRAPGPASQGLHVKILDLGLARATKDDQGFTHSGMIVGTPAFMSPEQARGKRLDARSDLFSLGAVLFRLGTGRQPFQGEDTMAVLTALAVDNPPPVHELNPAMPLALSNLVRDLLAKNVADRPVSAEAVVARLRQIEDNLAQSPPRAEGVATTQVRSADDSGPTQPVPRAALRNRLTVPLVLFVTTVVAAVAGLGVFPALFTRPEASPPAVAPSPAVAVITPPATEAPSEVRKPDSPAVPPAKKKPVAAPKRAKIHKVYLSTMQPIQARNWIKTPPPPPPDPSGMKPPPPAFSGIFVEGRPSPHGLFMHPPLSKTGGSASISFHLGGQYVTFQTEVSLNDGPEHSATPLTFCVYGDRKLLWKSRPVARQIDGQRASLAVSGIQVLTLELHCNGDPRGAHAVWIEPIVSK